MKFNVIRTSMATMLTMLMLVMVGCQKSPYEKAISYIDELSEDVTSATDMQAYDAVYNKIVNLKSNALITDLKDLSDSQKRELTVKIADLTLEALAVKAILYEMPATITPTPEDIKAICQECIDKKIDIINGFGGYPEVKTLIMEHFHTQQ